MDKQGLYYIVLVVFFIISGIIIYISKRKRDKEIENRVNNMRLENMV